MKEAVGELNGTVVVVVAVAILATFFFSYVWPLINNNFKQNAKCSDAVCGFSCDGTKTNNENGTIECCYTNGNTKTTLYCPYKG
jgi:Na+/glutamate symporter